MHRKLLIILLPLTALAGCKTVGPDFAAPQAPSGTYAGTLQSGKAPVAVPGQGPQARWWEVFGSAELNTMP